MPPISFCCDFEGKKIKKNKKKKKCNHVNSCRKLETLRLESTIQNKKKCKSYFEQVIHYRIWQSLLITKVCDQCPRTPNMAPACLATQECFRNERSLSASQVWWWELETQAQHEIPSTLWKLEFGKSELHSKILFTIYFDGFFIPLITGFCKLT